MRQGRETEDISGAVLMVRMMVIRAGLWSTLCFAVAVEFSVWL